MPRERYEFATEEIGRILLERQGITEGYWEVGIKGQVDTAFTPSKTPDQSMLPTVMLRVAGLILTRVDKKTPASISPEKQVVASKG